MKTYNKRETINRFSERECWEVYRTKLETKQYKGIVEPKQSGFDRQYPKSIFTCVVERL